MEIRISAELWNSILQLILLLSVAKTSYCLNNLGNETDRIALLEFKANISSDPNGILSSWNDSTEFCKWEGVTCGEKHKRVTSLNLQGMSLVGTLSPYISNLTFVSFLDLSNNKFHGDIPQQVGFLFRLTYLNLSENTFEGEIPSNISYCSDLRTINLGINKLAGKIPTQLGFLNKLVTLILHKNRFTGEIPHSFGNLSSLEAVSLSDNHLQGNIPDELGQLKNFSVFLVASNNLTGTIPSTLYNLSSLTQFYATENKLKGSLPSNIGLTLPNLQEFAIGVNEIHGSIPISLANASQLTFLDISENKITGQVPNNLGYLKNLQWLNIGLNFLGNTDMDFVASLSNCSNLETIAIYGNNFRGMLPTSIANLSNLQTLSIGENAIYGKIPTGVGNLVDLYILSLRNNLFSGPIPDALGKLVNLQVFLLSGNKLSGEIPQSLCNLTRLSELSLYENKLEGNLITCIANCKNLQHLSISANFLNGSIPQQIFDLFSLITLNLSQNALTGLIPLEVGGLKNIYRIDISKNKLFGKIPEKIGDCSSLEYLYLEGNMLQGDIPSSLASLKGLQELDLSQNNLSENIPTELEELMFLRYLNLSFNNLKGEVPKNGVFSNLKAFSFDGNNDLCGGIQELHLPPCPIKAKKHKKSAKVIILAATISPIVIFIAIASLYVSYRQKSRKSPPSKLFEENNKLPRISYNELLQATNGFSADNIIGEGSFGLVYIGNLDPQREKSVAVKVLKLQQHGASKSFLAECKALRNIRHRNLVKILTYCSSIDFKGNDFKALVFDFMINGSLEMWLHPGEASSSSSRNLNLLQRLQVAIDVLSALYYLHENCATPIVHCDLKPSNILFDGDMTAHVSDFGLARLLSKPTNESSQGDTSSIGIKGTIGYMAPEYGVGSQATKQGDIYSFGIILLEIFTGRRPIDPIFKDGLNLHNFVKINLKAGGVMQVLDPLLIANGDVMEEDDGGDAYKCIVAVLEIGVSCSAELPADRLSMEDLNRKLNVIIESFLDTRTRGKASYIAH